MLLVGEKKKKEKRGEKKEKKKLFGFRPDTDNGKRAACPAHCLLMLYRPLVIHALQTK